MAKYINDTISDTALEVVDNNATRLHVCTTQPANYAGIDAVELAMATIDETDMTLANGDASGRKLTVAAQTGLTADATGTAEHIALSNGTDTLYLVTTVTGQSVTSGNTVNVAEFDWTIPDPS